MNPDCKTLSFILVLFFGVMWPVADSAAQARNTGAVTITKGATPIPNGDAQADKDITLQNGKIAVSFAAASRAPWGVAKGGILDLSIIRNGEYGPDIASLVDFLPDTWTSWPSSYQRVIIEKETPEVGVIRVERDWKQVKLVTLFTLKRDEAVIHIHTRMKNTGAESYESILSGYVLWADGGYFFNRPGLGENGSTQNSLTSWTASYEQNWALAMHAPYAGLTAYNGQDQYQRHTLEPGATAEFEGWLQVIDEGELNPAVEFELQREEKTAGTISGTVTNENGEAVEQSVVVVERNGKTYSWARANSGRFQLELPEGDYTVYAKARNHAASPAKELDIAAGEEKQVHLSGLKAPGNVLFSIRNEDTGEPLDAAIHIKKGPDSPIEYFGRPVMFTELGKQGVKNLDMAPGRYELQIQAGSGFLAEPVSYSLTVASGKKANADISVPVRFTPNKQNWYAADLHHHSDVLDGSTPVPLVLQSQLAAGLDVAFLSDHDSGQNNQKMDSLAALRKVPFIPSMEISPSWGHFNAYTLDVDASLSVAPSEAPADDIIEDARAMGAEAVAVNHPYISYGYFHSLEQESAPGGFEPSFDLVELNPADDFDRVFERLYEFWNRGLRIFLTAGSDTHDVWGEESGQVRMMAYVPGTLTAKAYVEALKSGKAYATTGPLMEPEYETIFGSQIRVTPGDSVELGFRVMSVHGLESIRLVSNGEFVEEKSLSGDEARVAFTLTPTENGWYQVIVEDAEGQKAYGNAVWIELVEFD